MWRPPKKIDDTVFFLETLLYSAGMQEARSMKQERKMHNIGKLFPTDFKMKIV